MTREEIFKDSCMFFNDEPDGICEITKEDAHEAMQEYADHEKIKYAIEVLEEIKIARYPGVALAAKRLDLTLELKELTKI